MTTSGALRAGAAGAMLLATTALTAPALAQSAAPPLFSQVDANGVDLFTGGYFFSLAEGSIGSGEGALSLVRNWSGGTGWTDNWSGVLYFVTSGSTSEVVVEFGTYSDRFTVSGSTYTSVKADGATLTTGSPGYIYTARDGTQIGFRVESLVPFTGPACQRASNSECGIPIWIRRPNGMTHTLSWDMVEDCLDYAAPNICESGTTYARFRGVSNSANYNLTINYATDTPGGTVPVANWYVRAGAQFTNLAGAPSPLPTVTYETVSNLTYVTDMGGLVWRLTNGGTGGRLTGIRRPGAGSDTTTIGYDGNGAVNSVTRDGVTTSYSRFISGSGGSMTVTDATGNETIYDIHLNKGRITSFFNEATGTTTSLGYDNNGRLTLVDLPEDNQITHSYDARGNVTQTSMTAKPGTGLAPIVTSATYPSSCSNPVTCNQPTSITDARGKTTDFTYDSSHGGLLTATAPAPSGSGDRPQTRVAYTQVTAVTGQPVWLPTEVSACASGTAPTCVGTANETRTVTAYDSANLRVASVIERSGDNAVSATSAFTYDAIGNPLTVDGPLAGSADTTRLRYDDARRAIGAVGPDPDGGGSLAHRAVRTTYTNGLPTSAEAGTVASQSDTDWAAFSALERVEQDYDANARPTVRRLMSGGTTYQLTQTSYNSLGQVDCVAQRMNPGEFASLPASACALDTEGSHGPDRISMNIYDAAGRLGRVRTALGTALERDLFIRGYTPNGLVTYIQDAENNVTDYVYDGHDRLSHIFYPVPTQGAEAASSSDYEQFTYDAGGNVTNRRLRDATEIAYSYDALGRPTSKDLPGTEPTVSYSYDLLGRLTGASTPGYNLTFGYDALGRQLTASGPLGTLTSEYDLAGRRIRLAYPGSTALTVGYTYNLAGEMTAVHENPDSASVALATFSYDDRGRRISLSRGNGAVTTYGYDTVSRLTQIVQNPSGTGQDLTLDFTFNPAGQIASTTRSNDAYAWGGHYAVNRTYTANGLNQYSAIGGNGTAHDARGNITNDAVRIFVYNSENRLRADSAGASQSYDPLGRLDFTYHQFANPPTSGTSLLSDGDRVVAELGSSNAMLRRYVFGSGLDEPIVRYEGSGLSDRHWYHADERGSVIASSDGSGAVTAINRYDEQGIPASSNTGRFQYTGQQWIAEFGMYHYRARTYSPTLGRFLQTDPIGYGAGMNLYAYVGNDPINRTDPFGLEDKTLLPTDIVVIGDPWWWRLMRQINQQQMRIELRLRQARATNERAGNADRGSGDRQDCSTGEVTYYIGSVNVIGVLGFTVGVGQFSTASGGHGTFAAFSLGAGLDLGVTGERGTARSLSQFAGASDTLSIGYGLGTATFNWSLSDGSRYSSGGLSRGPTFALSRGGVASILNNLGLSGQLSQVKILSLRCGGNE